MKLDICEEKSELYRLCADVRKLLRSGEYEKSLALAAQAIGKHPDSAIPQNVFGVVCAAQGNTALALRHFRAAWALDSTYLPARCNLDHCGDFFFGHHYAMDESECVMPTKSGAHITYDSYGIQHVEGDDAL